MTPAANPAGSPIPGPAKVTLYVNAVRYLNVAWVVTHDTSATQYDAAALAFLSGAGNAAATTSESKIQQLSEKIVFPTGAPTPAARRQTVSPYTAQEIDQKLRLLAQVQAQRKQALDDTYADFREFAHRFDALQVADLTNVRPSINAMQNEIDAAVAFVQEVYDAQYAPSEATAKACEHISDPFGFSADFGSLRRSFFADQAACLQEHIATLPADQQATRRAQVLRMHDSAVNAQRDVNDLRVIALHLRDVNAKPNSGAFAGQFVHHETVACGPAASTVYVGYAATDLTALDDSTRRSYTSPPTTVACGEALHFALGVGYSGVPNRVAVIQQHAASPAPSASPAAVNRFAYSPNNNSSLLSSWPGINTRLYEPNDWLAYYLSVYVKPNFKEFESFIGPSLLVNKSLFITPGFHIAPSYTLGGGYNPGDLVPGNVTTAPVDRSYTARFGVMLSFPVKSISGSSPKPAASPSSSPSPGAGTSVNADGRAARPRASSPI